MNNSLCILSIPKFILVTYAIVEKSIAVLGIDSSTRT